MFLKFVDPALLNKFAVESLTSGLSAAAVSALSNRKLKVKSNGSISSSGPQLIICNHPSAIDGLILMSVINRPDFYIVAAKANQVFGSTFTKQMLPVYLSNLPKHQFIDYLRVPVVTQMEGNISRKEAMSRNRASISQAAEKINNGHCVAIFPGGANPSQEMSWKAGIGFLIKAVTKPDLEIVLANITGTDWLDSIRPTILGRPSPLIPNKEIVVNFKKLSLNNLDSNLSGKSLARQVESIYRLSWQDQV